MTTTTTPIFTKSLNASNDKPTPIVGDSTVPSDYDRDAKFRNIIMQQFGEQGLTLTTGLSFIYIIVMLVMLLLFAGFLNTFKHRRRQQYRRESKITLLNSLMK